jgi:1,2-phenylacetyl-CoA epoxidase PaaB subunit
MGYADSGSPLGDQPHGLTIDTKMWEVYARRKYDEPLYQVGTVAADDPELGTVYARTIFNEFPWIEMVLVPRETVITVIQS